MHAVAVSNAACLERVTAIGARFAGTIFGLSIETRLATRGRMVMADAYRIPDEPDLAETLHHAVELQRQGPLGGAQRFFWRRPCQTAEPLGCVHFLGVLHHQRGNAAEALRCLAAALKANPTSVEILANYAFMLDAVGLLAEAVAAYDRILIVRPNDVDALHNRGNAQTRLGRLKQ